MTCKARRLLFDYYREKSRKPCPIRLPRFFSKMTEICATLTKPLRRRAFRLDGLITPTPKAAGSNPVGHTKMNDSTQFEQVDETYGLSRVVLCSKSLDMIGVSGVVTPNQIWDMKTQTVSKCSGKRTNQAIRTQMSHLSFLLKFSSIWHGVRFFNVRCGRLAL